MGLQQFFYPKLHHSTKVDLQIKTNQSVCRIPSTHELMLDTSKDAENYSSFHRLQVTTMLMNVQQLQFNIWQWQSPIVPRVIIFMLHH